MTRTIAAAIFALLAVIAPARAAMVDYNVNLNFGSNEQVTGNVALTYTGGTPDPYSMNADLSLNGATLNPIGGPPAPSGTLAYEWFVPAATPGSNLVSFVVFSDANLTNLIYPNFGLGSIFNVNSPTPATSGTVASAVPLPAAFPLFGTALAGLAGVGWLKNGGRFHTTIRRQPPCRSGNDARFVRHEERSSKIRVIPRTNSECAKA
jgi:hypothetical protein